MAKRKHNKSSAIRAHFEQNPNDKPKVIVEALKAQGIPAEPGYVSMILSKLRKGGKAGVSGGKKPGKRRGRPAGSGKQAAVAVVSRPARGSFGFDELRLARQLVNQMGGADAAKQLIDALA